LKNLGKHLVNQLDGSPISKNHSAVTFALSHWGYKGPDATGLGALATVPAPWHLYIGPLRLFINQVGVQQDNSQKYLVPRQQQSF